MFARIAALGLMLSALAAAPAIAEGAGAPHHGRETCAEVGFGSGSRLKIPCPPGIRPLLEQIPRILEPGPRRDIVVDPDWPHDQAMIAEQDWPHDQAMIAPPEEPEKPHSRILDELLGALDIEATEGKVRQLLDEWLPGDRK